MISIEDIFKGNYERFKGNKINKINFNNTSYILKMHNDLYLNKIIEETGLNAYNINKILKQYNLKSRVLTNDEKLYIGMMSAIKDLSKEQIDFIREFSISTPISEIAIALNLPLRPLVYWCELNNVSYIKAPRKDVRYDSETRKEILSKQSFYSNLLTNEEEEFIETLRPHILPKEIANRLLNKYNKKVSPEQIKHIFTRKNELFVTNKIFPKRQKIIDDLLNRGITDIETIYKECLITRDVLEDYINNKKIADQALQNYFKERKEKQAEGIAIAKIRGTKTGRPFGRPKIPMPENFEEEYIKWKEGKQTAKKTMENLGNIKRGVFYKFIREYENSESNMSKFKDEKSKKSNNQKYVQTILGKIPIDKISKNLKSQVKIIDNPNKIKSNIVEEMSKITSEFNTMELNEEQEEPMIVKQEDFKGLPVKYVNQLKDLDCALNKIVDYANNHDKISKDVLLYILEENGFKQMVTNMHDFIYKE